MSEAKPIYLHLACEAEMAAWKEYSRLIDFWQDAEALSPEVIAKRRERMDAAGVVWVQADREMKAAFQRWHDDGQAIPVAFTVNQSVEVG